MGQKTLKALAVVLLKIFLKFIDIFLLLMMCGMCFVICQSLLNSVISIESILNLCLLIFTISILANTLYQNLTFDKVAKKLIISHKNLVENLTLAPNTLVVYMSFLRSQIYMNAAIRSTKKGKSPWPIVNYVLEIQGFKDKIKPLNKWLAYFEIVSGVSLLVVSVLHLFLAK